MRSLLLARVAMLCGMVAGNGRPSAATYPGRPPIGSLYWGAAIHGNGDPVSRHEEAVGASLSVRRTFFLWSDRATKMIRYAKDDIAHNRLPWVSVKTLGWSAMAEGKYDAQIDEMLAALKALPGPVWLTVWHEPEGGGGKNYPDDPAGPSGHVAMNRRVRSRMTELAIDNVALAPILMSWTWDKRSGRDPDQWWTSDIYDFVGVDCYADAEKSLLDDTWYTIRAWAARKGAEVAVGEWGMRGIDSAAGARVRQWYEHAADSHADGKGARVVALSAFDSNLNSPSGGWELKGEQLRVFRELSTDPRTYRIRNEAVGLPGGIGTRDRSLLPSVEPVRNGGSDVIGILTVSGRAVRRKALVARGTYLAAMVRDRRGACRIGRTVAVGGEP